MQYFIGIDLAWGETNASGFCVFKESKDSLEIVELTLLQSLDDIVKRVEKYSVHKISIGIDAPIIVPNESGNRKIEKEFIHDFSQYKISMLPVNRDLLTKYTTLIRGEALYLKLLNIGFSREIDAKKRVFEVYPHATIAVCFNNYKILPYKRKKGRDTPFIRKHLAIYRDFLSPLFMNPSSFFENLEELRGKGLKGYEDKLDAITCAYTLYYTQMNPYKTYKLEGIDTFITPI